MVKSALQAELPLDWGPCSDDIVNETATRGVTHAQLSIYKLGA